MKQAYLLFITLCITVLSFAQNIEDTTDDQFHDDLLNHLVGKWDVTSIAHGRPFTSVIEAKWMLNHQFFHIHFKSNEIVPWFHVPMEYEEFIGYNHSSERFIVHGMSIEGDEDPSEGLAYGYHTGNEFKTVSKFGVDSFVVQRLIWEPASNSWNIRSHWQIAGKEREVFLDMKLVAHKNQM